MSSLSYLNCVSFVYMLTTVQRYKPTCNLYYLFVFIIYFRISLYELLQVYLINSKKNENSKITRLVLQFDFCLLRMQTLENASLAIPYADIGCSLLCFKITSFFKRLPLTDSIYIKDLWKQKKLRSVCLFLRYKLLNSWRENIFSRFFLQWHPFSLKKNH